MIFLPKLQNFHSKSESEHQRISSSNEGIVHPNFPLQSRKQFWQPCHMKFANRPISFRLNKKVGLKWQFCEKILTRFHWTRRMQFRQHDREIFARILWKMKAQLYRRKTFCCLKKFLQSCLTQILQPWWNFSAKRVRKYWEKVRKWVWVYDFSSKICNLIQNIFLHTKKFKTVSHHCRRLFWRVRNFVAHSAKTSLKLCSLKKITLRHSPKMILNL